MKDEELKEVTVKKKLEQYKFGMLKAGVGLGLIALGGIGTPIVGNMLYNSPDIFNTMAMVTIPITGIAATMYGIKLKGYFDLKNKAKEDESEKSKSL